MAKVVRIPIMAKVVKIHNTAQVVRIRNTASPVVQTAPAPTMGSLLATRATPAIRTTLSVATIPRN